MTLISQLSGIFGAAFASRGLDGGYGAVVPSQRPELAQFQCNGALSAAGPAGEEPRALAESVIAAIADDRPFSELSVAGPGFINITLTDEHLAAYVEEIARDDRRGVPSTEHPKKVVVDYGGPNVAKAMHVGHLRPSLIGESLRRLTEFVGHDVVGDVHMGDWGTQMGQLIIETERRMPELPYFDPQFEGPYPQEPPVTLQDLEDMYPVVAERTAADTAEAERARQATVELQRGRPGYRALWQHFRDVSLEDHARDFDDLGVGFDLWHGESTVHDRVGPMIDRLVSERVAVESEGAVIVDVVAEGETKEIPPLILTKSDGGYLYGTTDLATIEQRVRDLGAGLILYVVDARQSLHFEQVFRAAYRSGIAPPGVELEHIGFGTVNGPDGRPFKTREGGVPKLRDLISDATDSARARLDEAALAEGYPDAEREDIARKVGLAALKFGDLSNHRMSDYVFDLNRFTSFEGKTGPYLLYGAVRMKSILRRAAEQGLTGGSIIGPGKDAERDLMLQLVPYPEVVARAFEVRAPNHIAEYAYELVSSINRFYEQCHILREEDPVRQASWLSLLSLTLAVLTNTLDLLGIEVPERM